MHSLPGLHPNIFVDIFINISYINVCLHISLKHEQTPSFTASYIHRHIRTNIRQKCVSSSMYVYIPPYSMHSLPVLQPHVCIYVFMKTSYPYKYIHTCMYTYLLKACSLPVLQPHIRIHKFIKILYIYKHIHTCMYIYLLRACTASQFSSLAELDSGTG